MVHPSAVVTKALVQENELGWFLTGASIEEIEKGMFSLSISMSPNIVLKIAAQLKDSYEFNKTNHHFLSKMVPGNQFSYFPLVFKGKHNNCIPKYHGNFCQAFVGIYYFYVYDLHIYIDICIYLWYFYASLCPKNGLAYI